jgi:hypothetical protein
VRRQREKSSSLTLSDLSLRFEVGKTANPISHIIIRHENGHRARGEIDSRKIGSFK